jgi:hypothetical protein
VFIISAEKSSASTVTAEKKMKTPITNAINFPIFFIQSSLMSPQLMEREAQGPYPLHPLNKKAMIGIPVIAFNPFPC